MVKFNVGEIHTIGFYRLQSNGQRFCYTKELILNVNGKIYLYSVRFHFHRFFFKIGIEKQKLVHMCCLKPFLAIKNRYL